MMSMAQQTTKQMTTYETTITLELSVREAEKLVAKLSGDANQHLVSIREAVGTVLGSLPAPEPE